jgi:6-pyruvoyl-tetrahydropterin synthase
MSLNLSQLANSLRVLQNREDEKMAKILYDEAKQSTNPMTMNIARWLVSETKQKVVQEKTRKPTIRPSVRRKKNSGITKLIAKLNILKK